MNSLPASTRPSLSSFSGCARHWLFSQVAPVANFYFKLRTSLTFSQVAPVADFAPGYACRWLFFRVAGVRRWLPSQVAHIADFLPGYARRWLLFPGRTIPSLTSCSDFACRWLLFHRSRQSQFFFQICSCRCYFFPSCAYRWILPASTSPSLTSFSGWRHCCFFPSLRPSLIFPSCDCRWFFWQLARVRHWLPFFEVAPVAEIFRI